MILSLALTSAVENQEEINVFGVIAFMVFLIFILLVGSVIVPPCIKLGELLSDKLEDFFDRD